MNMGRHMNTDQDSNMTTFVHCLFYLIFCQNLLSIAEILYFRPSCSPGWPHITRNKTKKGDGIKNTRTNNNYLVPENGRKSQNINYNIGNKS